MTYRLIPAGDNWQATAITVEDVSLTANLGSQLSDLLTRMGVDDLLTLMRRKYGNLGRRSVAMKTLSVMLKDLRLISRDLFGLIGLLVVPLVVIVVIASATQSGDGSKSIVFPVVNEDQGPVATALIRAFREHLDVREVSGTDANHIVV